MKTNKTFIVALLLVVCAKTVLENKPVRAGWLFALSVFLKPYFLLLIFLFLEIKDGFHKCLTSSGNPTRGFLKMIYKLQDKGRF